MDVSSRGSSPAGEQRGEGVDILYLIFLPWVEKGEAVASLVQGPVMLYYFKLEKGWRWKGNRGAHGEKEHERLPLPAKLQFLRSQGYRVRVLVGKVGVEEMPT